MLYIWIGFQVQILKIFKQLVNETGILNKGLGQIPLF